MNRRQAIQRVAMLLGGSVIGANLFLEGCTRPANKSVEGLFEQANMDLLNELAEAILPRTSTPGAKDANVGAFIPVMIRDCYGDADQKAFVSGFSSITDRVKKEFGKAFDELSAQERLELVVNLDKEAKEFQDTRKKEVEAKENDIKSSAGERVDEIALNNKIAEMKDTLPNHFFTLLKQLTLTGFFTSEVGMTQALRYVKIPGKYIGDYPYKAGDRAWA